MQSEPERIAPAASSGRNAGVDTLRIVSMLMILCVHVLTQGGVLAAVQPGTKAYAAAWLLRLFMLCDVNCFALITGYVSVDARFRLSRPIALWFEVFFYSALISGIFAVCGVYTFKPDMALLPVFNIRWWYVTAYFGMVLFQPYLNLLFDKLTRKQASKLVFTVIFVLSVLPTIYNRDLFRTSFGYSMLWLMALYVLGAYIKRHEPFKRLRRSWLIVYAVSMAFVFAAKMLFPGWGADGDYFAAFSSTFVLVGSLALFLFFSRVTMPRPVKALTRFFAPMTFGVYLIHVHPAVWNYLLENRFAFLTWRGALYLAAGVVGVALAAFLVCSAVDWLRIRLFKLIRAQKAADFLGDKLTALADRVFH